MPSSAMRSVLVVVVAVLAGSAALLRGQPSYMPWHNNDKWSTYLRVYDRMRDKMMKAGNCKSLVLRTTQGDSQLYACGDPSKPAVLLLSGASSSIMLGKWLIPLLVSGDNYVVAVDYPFDCGRSVPTNGDPATLPSTEKEIADWVGEIVLDVQSLQSPASAAKVSLVGYSMGSFIAFATALHKPELIGKVVLLAPAVTFSNLRPGWLLWAFVNSFIRNDELYKNFYKYMSGDPSQFRFEDLYDKDDVELILASHDLGCTVPKVWPRSFADDELRQVCSSPNEPNRCFLGIGDRETVIDPVLAAKRAAEVAGAMVGVYPKTGHLMSQEQPSRETITRDVVAFLTGNQ